MLTSDKIIAIDIDGTICTIEEDYTKCKLLKGCLEAIKLIRGKGFQIYLHTGRHINNFDLTISWLKENGVEYDHIIFGKPPAKYYIDDRAIEFTSWNKVMKRLKL